MAEAVRWAKDSKENFRQWMHWELEQTRGDRSALETKWRNALVQWRARIIGDGTSDVPFEGASDLEMPITAIHTDPVFADFMQTLHVPQDFWSIVGKRPDTVDTAKPIQEFLSLVERNYLDMRSINTRVLMDMIVFGTGIYKDYILHERKKVKDYDEQGLITDVTRLKFQPRIQHVPLRDLYIPAYSSHIDPDAPVGAAPWVAQFFELRKAEFEHRARAETPFLPSYEREAVKKVMNWEEHNLEDEVREKIRQEDQFQPWRDLKIRLYEVWARWDVDGDGVEEDIVVVWHHRSSTIVRATYNPFLHGKRPFEKANYLPGFGFYGLGVAEIDEWAQIAATNILNSTINNAFISNAVMLAVPFGSNVNPDEPIYPGKIWPIGPNEKIQEISFGRPNPQMYELLDRFMQWSEQRTGVSELRQGNITGLPSRTPASTVLSILNESNKRFDMVLGNLREGALKNLGLRVLQNLVQISKTDPRWKAEAVLALGRQDGMKVVEILDGPVHDVESKFGFSVTATSSQVNKEVEKQSFTAFAQVVAQMYAQLFQYAQVQMQMSQDPSQLLSTSQAAYNGTLELIRRMIEAYSIQNPDAYLPVPSQQQQLGAAPQAGPQLAQVGGAAGAAPFAQGAPQISQLLGVG